MRFALIGSRETPRRVLDLMSLMGLAFSEAGHFSYSGGAPGADEAWLSRYDRENSLRIIPYDGFNGLVSGTGVATWPSMSNEARIKSYLKAKSVYPSMVEYKDIIKTLFSRNSMQVFGADMMHPVDHIYFYAIAVGNKVKGGTGVAVAIARAHGIPCTNLYNKGCI